MRLHGVAGSLLVLLVAGCPAARRASEPPPVPELEADVCAVTREFSRALRGETILGPKDVVLAHGDDWSDLAYAYDIAEAEFERCLDPALEASLQRLTEVWPSRPPVSAVRKFTSASGGFDDRQASRIDLDTVNTEHGAELWLRVR